MTLAWTSSDGLYQLGGLLTLSLLCTGFYTVGAIDFGLEINIADNPGNYTIDINEEGLPLTRRTFQHSFSNTSVSHKIQQLKPCTKYELMVTFDNDAKIPCNTTNNEHYKTTTSMSE